MSILAWFCTHKYNSWKPAGEQKRPKNESEADLSALCMWVRMCVKCGNMERKYVHDVGPETLQRVYDGGDGYDYEITYKQCSRCGEDVTVSRD